MKFLENLPLPPIINLMVMNTNFINERKKPRTELKVNLLVKNERLLFGLSVTLILLTVNKRIEKNLNVPLSPSLRSPFIVCYKKSVCLLIILLIIKIINSLGTPNSFFRHNRESELRELSVPLQFYFIFWNSYF